MSSLSFQSGVVEQKENVSGCENRLPHGNVTYTVLSRLTTHMRHVSMWQQIFVLVHVFILERETARSLWGTAGHT